MNLTPTEAPRRHTTWHSRPVRASRAKASRMVAGSAVASCRVSLAPALEMSCTRQCRTANPPSSVIHAGCFIDLRVSRFLVAAIILLLLAHCSTARTLMEGSSVRRTAGVAREQDRPDCGMDASRYEIMGNECRRAWRSLAESNRSLHRERVAS